MEKSSEILTAEYLESLGFELSDCMLNECYAMRYSKQQIYINIELERYGALYPTIYINLTNHKNNNYLQYRHPANSEITVEEFWKCLELVGISEVFKSKLNQ